MVNTSEFVGLSEGDARILAAKAGLVVAINTKAPSMLTNSMQMNRITLHMHDGKVTSATLG